MHQLTLPHDYIFFFLNINISIYAYVLAYICVLHHTPLVVILNIYKRGLDLRAR